MKKQATTKKKAVKKVVKVEQPWAPPAEHRGVGLRTVDKDHKSHHNGFQWPTLGYIKAPDWNPQAQCGGGLHILPDGWGNWSLLSWDIDSIAQIVEYDKREAVDIDGQKSKVPQCNVIKTGPLAALLAETALDAATMRANVDAIRDACKGSPNIAYGYYSKAASSGYSSKAASSGDSSTAASSGDSSTAASSGDYSKAASSGYSSTAASSGDYSKAASSGDYSKAASSGDKTISMVAGYRGHAKAGPNGCLALAWDDGERPRIVVGYVGEDIKADTWYKVVDGKLTKA